MARIIELNKTLNCSLERLWWKWTTKEGLLSFFGQDNLIELKPNGSYEIYFLMDNPPGTKGGEGNKVLSYIPQEMLSFTWNAPPEQDFVRNHPHKTFVVLDFRALAHNTSAIRLRHLNWLEGEQWDIMYTYFSNAWPLVLEWLAKSCQND